MANLFNLDIDYIKHGGTEVLLMKLNGNIVYEKETFRIEYTVYQDDEYLNNKDVEGKCCIGLPRIYTSATDYTFGYSDIMIIKTDGTTTTDPRTKCNEIEKVILWYPENTYGIRFYYPYSSKGYAPAVKDVNYCNTSNFVSMNHMLYGNWIQNIKGMDRWKTKKVTDMSSTFEDSIFLTELDVSNFNTSNVTNMTRMFCNCYNVAELDVSNWDTSNVTSMSYMFSNCGFLTTLDLSNFDTSNVANMFGMFKNCENLISLDLSNFNTDNITEIGDMFSGCTALAELNLSSFKFAKETLVSTPSYMFENCTSLYELHLDNCDNYTLKNIINYGNLPTNIIDGVTKTIYCRESQIDGVNKPDNWVYSFVYEEVPEEPDIPDIPEEPEEPDTRPLYSVGQFIDDTDITTAEVIVNSTYTDLSYMFSGCTNLVSVNAESWDTSKVTNMNRMFHECQSLLSLDLSDFDTSKVTSMRAMFYNCKNLDSLDLSNWDTSSVTDIAGMFYNCIGISTLRLDNCSNSTISNIINNTSQLPTNTILNKDGTNRPRIIYCKRANAEGLTAPENWSFSYID